MATERIRQTVSGALSLDQIEKFQTEGWRAVAVEWERELPAPQPGQSESSVPEDPPFGLRVANDCATLEEHPAEKEILVTMMELIIEDGPYSFIAEQLNRKGYLTRHGSKWSAVSVFEMLPRLIEAGPRIFSTEEWQRRRQRSRQQGSRLPV
jgi:Recombinase